MRPKIIQNYSENDEVEYEMRAVAFIDILGWGKAVEDSVTEPELRKKLLNAVWSLGEISKNDVEDDTPEFPSYDQVTQFSDSIVISFPYSQHLDLMRLIRQITSYQHIMLLSGLPLRGGITVGPLYHSNTIVFGPAMNEAYYLESRFASYPRVIIAKALSDEVEQSRRSLPRHWPFVTMNEDGFYSTNFLQMFASSPGHTQIVDRYIARWLETNKSNEKVFEKYQWLKTQWEAAKLV